jgi:1-acyl-sn-glycerol-3-phosphate acyltransferase
MAAVTQPLTRLLESGDVRRLLRFFPDRWVRHGVILSFGMGFTIPYFRLFNKVDVEGDGLLETLPHKNVVFLANHQSYFMEAIAFFDLVYLKHGFDLEDPFLRFSAAEETMTKNALTVLFKKAGGVTFRRSFRDAGKEVSRPVDLEGVARLEEAIGTGWLLHFPAGTTQPGAPIRKGIAQILHRTRAVAVPVRVDGFRRLLLHKQLPGKLFRKCSIRIHRPLDLKGFYDGPFERTAADGVVEQLGALLNDPA